MCDFFICKKKNCLCEYTKFFEIKYSDDLQWTEIKRKFRQMCDVAIWIPEEVGKADETLVENKKLTYKNLSLFPIIHFQFNTHYGREW